MANQAPLRNRIVLVLILWPVLWSCQQKSATATKAAIPAVFVSADQSGWQQRGGKLWLNNQLFSGWRYQLWPGADTAFVGAFRDGKATGRHRFWYEHHRPKEIRNYQNGWQEGVQRGWFDSGRPAFVYHFRNDVYEGRRTEWYPTGQLARDGQYHEGQENGTQRLWFADGSLKANYAVRHGRHYGFTGVKHCVNVWDSIRVAQ